MKTTTPHEEPAAALRRSVRAAFLLCFGLGSLFVAHMVDAAEVPAEQKMVEFIVARHEELLASIKDLQYESKEVTTQEPTPDRPITRTEISRTVTQRGKWRSTGSRAVHTLVAGGSEVNLRNTVLNDTYFASRIGTAGPEIYDHASIDSMAPNAQVVLRGDAGPDLLQFGFGDGLLSLSGWYRHSPDPGLWTVSESKDEAGQRSFVIRQFAKFMKDPAIPYYEWHISVDQGFLATRLVKRTPKTGRPFAEVRVTAVSRPQENESLCLPARVEVDLLSEDKQHPGTNVPYRRNVYEFGKISVNKGVPDETFTLANFHCKDGSFATKVAPNGAFKTLVMVNNQAVPTEVAAKVLNRSRRAAPLAGSRTAVGWIAAAATGSCLLLVAAAAVLRRRQVKP